MTALLQASHRERCGVSLIIRSRSWPRTLRHGLDGVIDSFWERQFLAVHTIALSAFFPILERLAFEKEVFPIFHQPCNILLRTKAKSSLFFEQLPEQRWLHPFISSRACRYILYWEVLESHMWVDENEMKYSKGSSGSHCTRNQKKKWHSILFETEKFNFIRNREYALFRSGANWWVIILHFYYLCNKKIYGSKNAAEKLIQILLILSGYIYIQK